MMYPTNVQKHNVKFFFILGYTNIKIKYLKVIVLESALFTIHIFILLLFLCSYCI
jgi:hypothetical protein